MNKFLQKILPTLGLLFASMANSAQAHPGHGQEAGLLMGFLHPLGGLDHLCAMLAVGLWAAQSGGRAFWLIPSAFVFAMSAGALLGINGVYLPWVELTIAASVLILGLFVATKMRFPTAFSISLVALFALAHGHAHGMEMGASGSGLAYFAGFLATTISLHGLGMILGHCLGQNSHSRFIPRLGMVLAVIGVFLLF